jgi:nucleotide-binding universal stress UspA family protein
VGSQSAPSRSSKAAIHLRSILVGYDGRPPAQDALALASRLADGLGAGLIAAFVSEGEHPFTPHNRPLQRALQEQVIALREQASNAVGNPDRGRLEMVSIPAVTPPIGLHHLALDRDCGLLVVGSTHRGPVGRVLAGSTGARLLVDAPCPVAIAPRGFAERAPSPIASIGVGVDGSPSAEVAFARASELSKALGARLVELAASSGGDRPEPTLERAAEGLDLLVVGSRSSGPLGHATWGSVSRALMHQAPSPVIVVPQALARR